MTYCLYSKYITANKIKNNNNIYYFIVGTYIIYSRLKLIEILKVNNCD